MYNSQHKQDAFVDFLLNKKLNGVFIDIGAYDGVALSNSYFFETKRGWTGICVEPIPERFAKLDEARNCIKVQGAIASEPGMIKFTHVSGYAEMLSGISSQYNAEHKQRIQNETKEYGGEVKEIEVKAYNLNQVATQNNINQVDFLSIDVEGGELEILKSIDFNKLNVHVLCIENNYNDNQIREIMIKNNFFLAGMLGCDDVFVKNTNILNNTIVKLKLLWFKLRNK